MIPAQDSKWAVAVAPGAIKDNAAFTATEIDTQGFSYLSIPVQIGATDIAAAVLKVQESDTSGSGFADVTGLVWGTSADIAGTTSTLPSATDDNEIFLFEIDLRLRKRYIKVGVTAGDGTAGSYASGLALLTRAAVGPTTAATKGCKQVLRV